MGSLKKINSTQSSKGTAKAGGSLVRISTGEKIKYNEDPERSLSKVSDAQKQAAEGRYQAYVSSSRNATSNRSDTAKNEPYELWRNASAPQTNIPIQTTNTTTKRSEQNPSILERVLKTVSGGLKQSAGGTIDSIRTLYEAHNDSDVRDMNQEAWRNYQNQADRFKAEYEEMLSDNQRNPGTWSTQMLENYRMRYENAKAAADNLFKANNMDIQSGTSKAVADISDSITESAANDIERAKQGGNFATNVLVDAGASLTQVAGDIMANQIIGAPGSMIPFAARAFGGATQKARQEGADIKDQIAYGGLIAAKEVFTEKMFNIAAPYAKAYGKGFSSVEDSLEKGIRKAVDKFAKTEAGARALGGALTFGASSITEGLEELIGDWMEWQLPRIYGGDVATAGETLSDSLYDFLVGSVSGGFGSVMDSSTWNYDTTNVRNSDEKMEAQNDAGEKIASPEGSFTHADKNSAERVLGANTEVDTLSDDLASGKRVFHESLTNEQYEALSNRDDVDVDASGNVFQVNPAQHIDRRSVDSVGSRTMNAFQFDHPQLHSYYQEAAQALINDADMSLQAPNSRRYERTMQGNKVIQSANTSAQLREAMDSTGLSRNEIIDAAQRIINDQGQENVKAAKQVELILDTMLTNGYTTMSGETVAPNEAYTKEKGRIVGSNQNVSEELPIYDMEAGIVQAAYEAGKANLPRQSASLDTDAQIAAYEQGRRDYILSNPTVANSKTGAYTVSNEAKEGVKNGERGVHLRESGQRSDRADSAKQVSKLEKGAGRNQSREAKRRPRDGEAAHLTYGKKVSSAEMGIRGGKTNDGVFLIKSGSTQATREAQRIANERGLKLVLFAGHDIHTNTAPDGARGYTDGTTLYVRVDDPDFTAYQITKHEVGHDMIAKGEVDIDAVRERIASIYGKDSVRVAAELYATAYAGTGMTAEEVWEECICDALGGMNIFRDTPADEFVDYFHSVTKKETEAIRQAPRAPPSETIGKYSRYWTPKLSKGEWSLLNNRMEKEMADSDNTLDDATKWLYASEKGTTVFALYGIGDGTEATVLYASSRKKAQSDNEILQKYLEGYDNEFDKDGAEFNQWVKSVRSQQGNRRHDIRDAGRGTEVSKDGRVHGEPQKRDGKGSSGTSKENRGGVTSEKTENGKYSRRLDDTYISAVNDGNMKEAQKLVDEAAESAMPDSKIRDKDGKLKPVYHGTKDMFWTFDTSVQGGVNGTAEGFGIYTSDNPAVTSAYGDRQLKMYANITKPATSTKKTITTAKLSALIKDTCKRQAEQLVADGEYESVKEALMDTWVSNYVYTYDIGMERAYRDTASSILQMNDSDMAVIQEVMSGMAIRGYDDALSFYRNSLTPITGFDGFVTQWTNKETGEKSDIILALDSSQLKSADAVTNDDNGNVIPLSQRFNSDEQDIRYSRIVDTSLIGQEIKRQMDEGKTFKEAVDAIYQSLIDDYGAIDPGENPYRDIKVPKQSFDKKKVSQTVRTILEAQATPDAAIPKIEEMVATGDFSYDVYTDKDAIADAESKLKHDGWANALTKWTAAMQRGEVSKQNTAMGWALYNNAANDGDVKTAMTVLDYMVRHQRNAAQAVQATRILKKLSPDTQLYHVQRSVESLQEELNKRYGNKKSPKLKVDEDLAGRYMQAKNQDERDEVLKDIYRDIGRQMPSNFRDKWNAWRYLAMLGNARTHVRNIAGNAVFAPAVAVKNMTATAIESAVSRVSGGKLNRSKGMVGFSKADRALLSAAWNDFDNVQESALGGGKYSEFQNANKYIEEGREVFKFKPLEAARKGNSKALDAEDMWFSRPHYAYAMAQYCKANNITAEQIAKGKAIKPARTYAIREAQKATYRDANYLSDAVSKFGRVNDKSNPVKKFAGIVAEGVMPFKKTPANILMRGIEYSPVGLLNGIKEAAFDVRSGKKTGAEAIDAIASGLTGTGILALGIFMAAQGLVRGAGGGDDNEKEFEKLTGHQDYSLEVGGKSYTLDWLAPESIPFFVGVNLWEATKDGGLTASEVLDTASMITEPILEMSMLQSLNDVFEKVGSTYNAGIKGLPAAIANAVTSYLTQAIPTLLGQAERTGQDVRMTTYTDKNSPLNSDMQYALGSASSRIPGFDYNQIPYIDAWGRTESSGGIGWRAFNNFLNPSYTSSIDTSDMEEELMRLYKSTGDANVFPKRASKYFTVDKERKDLTADEYVQYATLKGQKSYELLSDLVNSRQYQSMSDEEKAKAVDQVYDLANQQAKAAISEYQAQSWTVKAVEAEKKYGISQDVYISLKTQASGIQSLKDKDGKTIDNSLGLQIMEMVYNTPGLTEKQRQAMFEYLGVGSTIRHYNKALVKEKLSQMSKQAK